MHLHTSALQGTRFTCIAVIVLRYAAMPTGAGYLDAIHASSLVILTEMQLLNEPEPRAVCKLLGLGH